MKNEIIGEIYQSLVLLGAESDLLGTLGSWGEGLADAIVLENLRQWNDRQFAEIRGRIEHYEMTSRRFSDNPGLDQRTSL